MNTSDTKIVQLIDYVAEFTKRAADQRKKQAKLQDELKKKAEAVANVLAEHGHIEVHEKEAAVSALLDHQKALSLMERLSNMQAQNDINIGSPVVEKRSADSSRRRIEEADRKFREALIGAAGSFDRI